MNTNLFSFFAILAVFSVMHCRAEQLTDSQLLKISQNAFDQRRAVKSQILGKKAIQDGFAHLSDAQKTRAMVLRIFDLDANDNGRMRFNTTSSMQNVLFGNPSLISDPTELKTMIKNETDARRFYILACMAGHFMRNYKSDFVVELAPMLFRHEPMAKIEGEYYFKGLTDASFFTYGMITKNLRLLNADFIEPDENLPYPDKITILVKWLRENYPGCEQLGEQEPITYELRKYKSIEKSEVRHDKKISTPSADQPADQTSADVTWWQLSVPACVLVAALAVWIKLKLNRKLH